ncbi:MAG: hypothetical protein PUE91_06760 [Clostridiales bacterium]|nr:hypothetical protein [Clostridiales bacterium]
MATPTISSAQIDALEHLITALEDRPAMSAADLKAYFDASPIQLMQAHNRLVKALTGTTAAENLGFSATAGISGTNIQAAVEDVQQQLADVALGSVPDGSISEEKLSESIQNDLSQLPFIQETLADLQSAAAKIRPSGAQFPLMVYVSSETCLDTEKDELSTAALGYYYSNSVYDLGQQLGWLCQWKRQTIPSEAFLAKQNITEILEDPVTRDEIAQLPAVLQLIQMSTAVYRAYQASMEEET